ncbi:hypothetical protein E8E14_007044 [Neopestalotiopsis sp. 37M]|nr:hypothetical protein E8E14_007044 [Neopestalotiopsis sp. 37M]
MQAGALLPDLNRLEANSLHLAKQKPRGVTTLVFNKPKELVTKEEDAVNKKKKIRSIVGDDAKLTEGLDNFTDWWNAMVDQHPPRMHIQLDVLINVLETIKPNQHVTNSTIYTSCRERFQAIIKEGARTGWEAFPGNYTIGMGFAAPSEEAPWHSSG